MPTDVLDTQSARFAWTLVVRKWGHDKRVPPKPCDKTRELRAEMQASHFHTEAFFAQDVS